MSTHTPIHSKRLWRTIGLHEYQRTEASGRRRWPSGPQNTQPLEMFLTQGAAADMARLRASADTSDAIGIVTTFEVRCPYVEQFEPRTEPSSGREKLLIAANQVASFNDHILGFISVVEVAFGDSYDGPKIPIGWPCPACGFLVHQAPAVWSICPLCDWEDDEVQLRHPTVAGGANSRSLVEWQEEAVDRWPLDTQQVDGFTRDPDWRPWDDDEEKGKRPQSGSEYFAAVTQEAPLNYYWRRHWPQP